MTSNGQKGIAGSSPRETEQTQTMKIEVTRPGIAMLLTEHGGGVTICGMDGYDANNYTEVLSAIHMADDTDWIGFTGTQFNPDLEQVFYSHTMLKSEIKQVVELTDDMWEKTISQMVPGIGPSGFEIVASKG